MISSTVVNRYANALADVVLSSNSGVDAPLAAEQLRSFDAVVRQSPDLHSVLASPSVAVARKRAIIKSIAERLGLAPIVRNFVLVLSDHGRAAALSHMVDAFEALLDDRLGFERADVHSAFELDAQQQSALSARLSQLTGKPVRMRYTVDPALIGGVTARIASRVYDGSVRGQLGDMRKRLSLIQ